MKRIVITLLAFISFPSIVNANLDPKIAEMCMKAADFKGCVESMSGEETNILSTNSKLNEAINDLNSKDPAGALSKVNLFLKENKDIKFRLEVVSLRDSKTAEPIVVEINILKITS